MLSFLVGLAQFLLQHLTLRGLQMADTNYTDQVTPIISAWLNDVNIVTYRALGSGGVAPTTGAGVLSNLGLSATNGATLIGFIQTGSGAVTRTVNAKLLESMTAADFNTSINYTAAQATMLYNQFALSSGGQAGNTTLTGSQNTAVGYTAMAAVTTGTDNNAFGAQALTHLTTGTQNNAIGVAALQRCTTGSQNVAEGESALFSLTTGLSNTAVGTSSLNQLTTGQNNVALGQICMLNVITGQSAQKNQLIDRSITQSRLQPEFRLKNVCENIPV